MELFADYHTHTKHSHGKGKVLDNVAQAELIGLDEIAISDHGPGHMFGIGIKIWLFSIRFALKSRLVCKCTAMYR